MSNFPKCFGKAYRRDSDAANAEKARRAHWCHLKLHISNFCRRHATKELMLATCFCIFFERTPQHCFEVFWSLAAIEWLCMDFSRFHVGFYTLSWILLYASFWLCATRYLPIAESGDVRDSLKDNKTSACNFELRQRECLKLSQADSCFEFSCVSMLDKTP